MTEHDPRGPADDLAGTALAPHVLDALAGIAAATDPGPDTLDIPDTPDLFAERAAAPRPEDGPQDVDQTRNLEEPF